jgi:hypothetical protein
MSWENSNLTFTGTMTSRYPSASILADLERVYGSSRQAMQMQVTFYARRLKKYFQANRAFNRIADKKGALAERRRHYWRGVMLRQSDAMGFPRSALPFALKTPSGRAPAVESHQRYKI